MNRYLTEAIEIENRIKTLYERKKRFQDHPTLNTRIHFVEGEISELEKKLPNLYATARWADELYGRK